jgi:hypothetical protein
VTQHIHAVSDSAGYPDPFDQLDPWLTGSSLTRSSRWHLPSALLVARLVLATVLLAVVFGLPPLLRSVGAAID